MDNLSGFQNGSRFSQYLNEKIFDFDDIIESMYHQRNDKVFHYEGS